MLMSVQYRHSYLSCFGLSSPSYISNSVTNSEHYARSRNVHMASEQESSTPVTSCAKPQCLDRLKIVQIGLFQWLVSIFKVEIQVSIIVGLIVTGLIVIWL